MRPAVHPARAPRTYGTCRGGAGRPSSGAERGTAREQRCRDAADVHRIGRPGAAEPIVPMRPAVHPARAPRTYGTCRGGAGRPSSGAERGTAREQRCRDAADVHRIGRPGAAEPIVPMRPAVQRREAASRAVMCGGIAWVASDRGPLGGRMCLGSPKTRRYSSA
ncbi:hypothetical protein GCM10018792_64950 [Streptomyces rubradiris]|nr:hypothetical protein GCM10018792_64950 [Streptomyces rubradiris]